jgi:hypothetical protein
MVSPFTALAIADEMVRKSPLPLAFTIFFV